MQRNIIITIIIIIIVAFIIISGCGGGDNVTPDISNQNNIAENPEGEGGYINIRVIWPQSGVGGTCSVLSGSENPLTASMPVGTNRVEVAVFEKVGENLYKPFDNATHTFTWTGQEHDGCSIGPLPLVVAKVCASAWQDYPATGAKRLLAELESTDFQINSGVTEVSLNLGAESLSVWAKENFIFLFPQLDSSAIVQPTPVPELGGETEIIARLVLSSPDIPPQPTMTPFGGSEVSGSNLEAQGEVGLENYEVKLTIVEGVGELIPAAGGTLVGDTVVTYTDNYGYCNAILKTNRPGTIKIKAECDLLATATTLSTSGDRILTAYCTVTAAVPGGGEDALLYRLELDTDYQNIRVIPDFRSPDGLRLNLINQIKAYLWVLDLTTVEPGDPWPDWQDAPYKTINFEIIEGWGADVSPPSVVTDPNGCAYATASITDDIETERKITVQGSFERGSTPGDPNHMVTEIIDFSIETDPDVGDNFDLYPPNTKAYELCKYTNRTLKWDPMYWQTGGDAMVNGNNCISSGANGTAQSIQLYTSPTAPFAASITTKISQFPDFLTGPFELRFYVKIGNETLNDSEGKRGIVAITGVWGEDTLGGMNTMDLITFKDKGNLILDCKGNTIGSFTPNTWFPVRIQFIDDLPGLTPGTAKVNYWIDNNFITSPTIVENLYYYEASHFLMLLSCGGTVWYDEVEIYDFNECIVNYY